MFPVIAVSIFTLFSLSISSSVVAIGDQIGADNRTVVEGRLGNERASFMGAFNLVSGIFGIGGSVIGAYWFGESKVKESKYSTDDIMGQMRREFNQLDVKIDDGFAKILSGVNWNFDNIINLMDTEFNNVKKELRDMFTKTGQMELALYQNVEESILGGLHDMRYNSSIALDIRSTVMFDRMVFFMEGLLGRNKVGTDIIKQLIQQYKCDSATMYNRVEQYVEMMYIGVAAMGYYNLKMPQGVFNGAQRVVDFIKLHEKVQQRVKEAQIKCA